MLEQVDKIIYLAL